MAAVEHPEPGIRQRLVRLAGRGGAAGGGARTLVEAVHDAKLLLSHAARHGIAVDAEVMSAAIVAEQALKSGSGTLTTEQECAFWPAFRALATAVAPVTVESLRATTDVASGSSSTLWLRLTGQEVSEARWAVFKYRWLALLFLVLLIAVQIFWMVGAQITKETIDLTARIETLRGEQDALADELGPEELGGNTRHARLEAEIDEAQGWLVGAYRSLVLWNRQWAGITGVVPLLESPFEDPDFDDLAANVRNRIEVTSAQFVLLALSAYVLPLLYGLLGAFAYVLRDVSREIRELTFSPDSTIRYGLRLSLGLLSGIAVGLFLSPGSADPGTAESGAVLTLKALSPLALAFLAGYAVELIFTAMDRLVGAFSGKVPGGRQARADAKGAGDQA